MTIGFGSTVLSEGLSKNKLDGIGMYSKSLLNEFKKNNKNKIINLRFDTQNKNTSNDLLLHTHLRYTHHSLLSAIFHHPIGNFKEIEEKIDIFFAPDHHIPHLKSTPVIATVMDTIPFIHPEWTSPKFRKLKNFVFKQAILSANHIITISECSKHDIIKVFNIKEENISVIPLGVDREYFNILPKAIKENVLKKYAIKEKFFIFIGTLQPRKNILRIIEAFEQLPRDIKETHKLIIIGRNGWETNELMDKIKQLEASNHGKWLNYVNNNDMIALLQSASALVYPSLYEGFGLPIIEAFASQCPVISSNSSSIPEVTSHAAILVNPYSVEEIKNAMYSIITNQSLRKDLIKKGLEQVKKFTWEKSAQAHEKVFNKVFNKL